MVNESTFTYKDIKFTLAVNVKEVPDADNFAKTGYFAETDMRKADEINRKPKNFSFCSQNKKIRVVVCSSFADFMLYIIPKN